MTSKVHEYTEVHRITQVDYVSTSVNANPTHRVHFDDGTSCLTEVDGSVGYGINNREFRRSPVEVTFRQTRRDLRIVHIRVAPHDYVPGTFVRVGNSHPDCDVCGRTKSLHLNTLLREA
jgi:hypothetical protein